MLRLSHMAKIFHSLRFQLPAVVLGVFLGILFLLMLFFHEMTIILVKTRQLAQSAEVNDYVSGWLNTLSSSARERTKLMSLGNESYLRSFQVTLNEINDVYGEIERISPDSGAASTHNLRDLHDKHLEYLQLLDGFAKDQTAHMMAMRAQVTPPPVEKDVAAPIKATGDLKGSRGLKGKGRSGRPASLASRSSKGGRIAMARSAKRKPRIPHVAVLPPIPPNTEPAKQIDLDTATNETFKAYEQTLREGLFQTQDIMRSERKDKLMSLRNSVGRAKDRLIYSLLLLLAMVGYVAIILKWKILDPMKTLKAGVVEIGKGDLGHQVQVKTQNEIGELAAVFNRMSVQLDQKRNAEVRLKRLEAIEQIVRSVNHEINNPLMIISGNAEYLLAILENSDEGVKSKLNSIVSEVRRIFMVTQRLKEIKEPVTENYIGTKDQMIDLLRSSQIRKREY